jgi:hypothetical protein
VKRFLTRTLAILGGIVLGMVIVAGSGPWRELFTKPDTTPPAPIQRERAPDTRV